MYIAIAVILSYIIIGYYVFIDPNGCNCLARDNKTIKVIFDSMRDEYEKLGKAYNDLLDEHNDLVDMYFEIYEKHNGVEEKDPEDSAL